MKTARNVGWCLLLGLMVLVGVGGVVGSVAAVLAGRWFGLVQGPAVALIGYWAAVGAWRRTSWGRVTVDAAALGPVLDDTHTRRMVLAAAAVPVVLALSLGLQVVAGRS